MLTPTARWLIGALFSVLLSVNGFFVKRLVESIDTMDQRIHTLEQTNWQLRQEIVILKVTFDNEKHKLCKIR